MKQSDRKKGAERRRGAAVMALAAILAVGTVLTACSNAPATGDAPQSPMTGGTQDRPSPETLAVAQPAIPQRIAEDDAQAWMDVLEENPVDQAFVDSLSSFAYRSSASVLGAQELPSANAMYSPLSLYYALALADEGADGQTAAEIDAVLGAPSNASVPDACAGLFRVLASDPFSNVALANSIWMAKDRSFEQPFIDTAVDKFYATPFSVEFGTDEADRAIAQWIADNTQGTLDPQVKTEASLLLSIINTVYFKGAWADAFDAANTASDTFHAESGDVEAEFMTQRIDKLQNYRRTDDFLRAGLSFAGGASMTFVLPAEGVMVEDLLADEDRLAEAFEVDANEDEFGFVTYTVPKAAFDTSFDLIPALERLGMETAFGDQADFSKLTSASAFISMVKQESHVAWDENGAEASAYTNIGIDEMSAMEPEGEEVELRLDRPFLFQIASSQGVPLFVGVCGNPAE